MSIICAGLACFDQFFFIDGAIKENFKKYSHQFMDTGGGPCGNAAYLLGVWGEKPYFAGKIGLDTYGEVLLSEFAEADVDTRLVARPDGFSTVMSAIVVNNESGSRTIITRKEKFSEDAFSPNLYYFKQVKSIKPKVILMDGHEVAISKLIAEANPNAKAVLDAGKLKPELIDLLPVTTHLVASEQFINEYSESEDWQDNDAKLLVIFNELKSNMRIDSKVYVTLGENGCAYLDEGKVKRLSAFKVKAVDTTGAGDIFHGAFCFGLVRGWEDEKILTFASATSALSIQKQGVRCAIPELKEVFDLTESEKLQSC
ncbi:PfkB family carbohydrate kinase [Vibrio coralliirubri]|uniref:carbohydrate kinase family protein n=1 Tax=Vibrio coralliirubri TaxID=1516159 RepID=UPI002284172E|nr:PfkB family carbohydrate kinase [Vibrio coralliirubri]MCY9861302.1 PfkB family carbohydrate kinase [Vibrio coralliirubri]